MTYSVAVIGQGRMARAHAAAWTRAGLWISHVLVRSDRGPLPEAPRATRVLDPAPILEDPTVRIVSVCTPGNSHESWARRALESGKYVLLEKPITTTAASARRLIRTASDCDGRLAVAHVVRFDEGYARIRTAALTGALGNITSVAAHRSIPRTGVGWWDDVRLSGGPLVDLAIHDFDQLHLLLGPPSLVSARAVDGGTIETELTYESASVRVTTAQHDSAAVSLESSLRVDGTQGWIGYSHRIAPGGPARTVTGSVDGTPLGPESPSGDPFTSQMLYLRACVDRNTAPTRLDPASATSALRLSLAARRSLIAGEAVQP